VTTANANVSPLVRRGAILLPDVIVEYEVWQPSPSQWVTIGRMHATDDDDTPVVPHLIVGTGSSELEAVQDLFLRVKRRVPPATQRLSVIDRPRTTTYSR